MPTLAQLRASCAEAEAAFKAAAAALKEKQDPLDVALMAAARRGDGAAAAAALVSGARVGIATPHIPAGEPSDVHPLLRAVALPPNDEPQANDGWTPLMYAAEGGHLGVVVLLLDDWNADPNSASSSMRSLGDWPSATGWSALMDAAQGGHVEVAQALLDRGADPSSSRHCDGQTALMQASRPGHHDVARLLLDCGADPNQAQHIDGCTALMEAAYGGKFEVARLLLERGADPNAIQSEKHTSALMLAASWGHEAVVQLLVCFGADIDGEDHFGRKAEDLAEGGGKDVLAGWFADLNDSDAVDYDAVGHVIPGKFWSPFRVAVALRLHAVARAALRLGRVHPTARYGGGPDAPVGVPMTLAELVTTASAAEWTLFKQFTHEPCPVTTALVHDAVAGWSPTRHFLFHPGVRGPIRTLLLAAARLRSTHSAQRQQRLRRQTAGPPVVPVLPPELWLIVFSFLLRDDWPVSAVVV